MTEVATWVYKSLLMAWTTRNASIDLSDPAVQLCLRALHLHPVSEGALFNPRPLGRFFVLSVRHSYLCS
jgi:hypothetical protein